VPHPACRGEPNGSTIAAARRGRGRSAFTRALIERLPNLKLNARPSRLANA